MRGLKAKTMRRVAREGGLPAKNVYGLKIHKRAMPNPEYIEGKGPLKPIIVERPQLLLGKCQRKMVKWMKRKCPKNSFFGRSLHSFRNAGSMAGMTITPMEAPV